ncbi:MAG: hypothetical protein IK078_02470 [Lachnospiraceae bacterium]|nr:hypothetical protein [Lachnospiraceae bacterium]
MAKGHDWVLLINLKKQPDEKPAYEGEYTFYKCDFLMQIFKEGVCIYWDNPSAEIGWTFGEETKSKDTYKAFRKTYDAVRKAYLLFALWFGKPLEIVSYKILCDGKRKGTITARTKGFPFIFSMTRSIGFGLEKSEFGEKAVFGNPRIMDYVINSNRSTDQEDKKMNALYAYLLSKSREFESDRLLNQWTAINAVYNGICDEHRKVVEKLIDKLPDEKMEKYGIEKEWLKALFTFGQREKDGKQLRYLERIIKNEYNFLKFTNSIEKSRQIEKMNNTYINYFSPFVKSKTKKGKVVFSAPELYERVLSGTSGSGWSEQQESKFQELLEWETKTGTSLYCLLTFDIPYFQRNDYIHGNEIVLLVSDNYHLDKLACLNYFMDRFLREYIPYMFDREKMESMAGQIHGFMLKEINDEVNKVNNQKKKELRAQSKEKQPETEEKQIETEEKKPESKEEQLERQRRLVLEKLPQLREDLPK